MSFKLGTTSRSRLKHVHPDLILVVGRAISLTSVDFSVLEGARNIKRQEELIAAGASKLKDPTESRHVVNEEGFCHAVDLGAWVSGTIRWDWPLYDEIAKAMKQAANDLGIPLEWGGDWVNFSDGPHFQLPRQKYS